jgi:nucleotide-binding universal stress UspA family protein
VSVLEEAKLGYDAVGIGVPRLELPRPRLSPGRGRCQCGADPHRGGSATVETRIAVGRCPALVPLSGSRSSRAAQEIAGYLSANIETHVSQLHVATNIDQERPEPHDERVACRSAVRHLVNEASVFATRLGANHTTWVESNGNAGDHIAAAAKELDVDLVVVSGTSRSGGGTLFLGHTIYTILEDVDCTVVPATSPEPAPKRLMAALVETAEKLDSTPVAGTSSRPELRGDELVGASR